MKTLLRWTLIITQVGGGFFGILITMEFLGSSENLSPILWMVVLGIVALYAFVILAGVLFALDSRKTLPLRLALWLQVLMFSSPLIRWWFFAGFSFNVTLIGGQLGFEYWLGSSWQFDLLGDLPWGVGINLFALLLLVLLGRQKYPQARIALSEQVDPLHSSISSGPDAHERGIDVQSFDEGDKSVTVRSGQYASLEAARRDEIELLIRSASRYRESASQQGAVSSSEDQYLDDRCFNEGRSSVESSPDINNWRYS